MPVTTLPRYALPNMASILPEFANSEQDFIRRTFQASNYDRIKTLPDDIATNNVHRARMDFINTALLGGSTSRAGEEGEGTSRKATNHNGLFREFEYMHSKFSLVDEIASIQREASEAKIREIGKGKDFRPAGTIKKLDHEEGFDTRFYPYHLDPYETAQDQILRVKWMEESKILSGPFIPSTGEKSLGSGDSQGPAKPTRSMQREIQQAIRKVIQEDWEDTYMEIYVNDREEWVLRFQIDTVDYEPGLVAYMNTLLRNELVNKHSFTKVVESWNVAPGDNFIYFTLQPPWVHRNRNEAFYRLHPETRVFEGGAKASRATTAASRR